MQDTKLGALFFVYEKNKIMNKTIFGMQLNCIQ
jgi:hypothetical protein